MHKKQSININGREIGPEYKPYVVAEISANHNGKIENAYKLIHKAKKAGVDAVKIQTYTADTITLESRHADFMIDTGIWAGKSLYELYQIAHTPWEWHKPLFDYARHQGVTIFSSPFDKSAVDLLEDLNAPAYKIASFEIVDIPLIRYAASTKKPLIISTGMAKKVEIEEAIDEALTHGAKGIGILHCVSGYPAKSSEYNLKVLQDFQKSFDAVTGISDHTLGTLTSIASVALGASIIEKHFTLNRNGGGPDDSFSLEPNEFKKLCEQSLEVWLSLGNKNYELKESESENVKFRRSLYFSENIAKGCRINESNVKSVRPGYGLAPKYIDQILGKIVTRNVERGEPVQWVDIDSHDADHQ